MFLILLLAKLVSSQLQLQSENNLSRNDFNKNFIYNKWKYDTRINIMVNSTTEQILDFYEEDERWRGYPSRVHVSTNDSIDSEYPLFITAQQQKGVLSWELPLVVQTSQSTMLFGEMARTLCPHDAGPNTTSANRPTLHVSTASPANVSVDIKLRRVRDFYVEVGKDVNMNVTPATPKYYYFSFDSNPLNLTAEEKALHNWLPRFNYSVPQSVLLTVESDDELCAVVSVQNNSCPVFDNEQDIRYQGYHLTMTTKGGITLTQSMFPVGFYIVLIVKQSDEDCTGVSETEIRRWGMLEHLAEWDANGTEAGGRMKSFRLRVSATISYAQYAVGAAVLSALVALGAALVLLLAVAFGRCQPTEEAVLIEEAAGPSSSGAEPAGEEEPIVGDKPPREEGVSECESAAGGDWCWSAGARPLTVAALSRARPGSHARRSDRYMWSALTVAVVYALPVVQLLYTYQRMVYQTGDQDLCYYNALCAHPLAGLADFNHVLSNGAYVALGLVFLGQTRCRQRRAATTATTTNAASPQAQALGIPEHHGLLYSLGLALVMEGVLSACYHLCPNKMNFQFDSSFMYVIAVLSMVKLYQNRHADVNAGAHATFMLIAVLMALGVLGIMSPSVWFWVLFTLLHLATCFALTVNIYYVGRFKFERAVVRRTWSAVRGRGGGLGATLRPRYGARAALLAVANIANWALAGYGLYEHNKDFARHLLAILMGNTILYTLFYVLMKLAHRERLLPHTWLYLALALLAWALALTLFLDSKTKWSETPAQSRRHNAACSALQLFDSHDLWHASSAAALFLSFNLLLTVDDALAATPRHLIPVF